MRYAVHDGVELHGKLYSPRSAQPSPIVIAVHGGAWKGGDAAQYQYWGPWLAERGIALFAIEYRLVSKERNRYPAAVHDVSAAVKFVQASAEELNIDGRRIGLMGSSAGAHLAALVALTDDVPVKTVIGVCGVYDLNAQWIHDQIARPRDQQTEIFLGKSPMEDRLLFYQASPLTYATVRSRAISFLISWGADDDVVDWQTQSRPFVTALKQAGCYVRIAPISDAPHFWMYDPIDEPHSFPGRLAPKLLRFLKEKL
jgi:acetyl esterase/lipase